MSGGIGPHSHLSPCSTAINPSSPSSLALPDQPTRPANLRQRQGGRRRGLLAVVLVLSAFTTGFLGSPSRVHATSYQGLTQEERQEFYHLSTGTQLIPYSWFLALEQNESNQPLMAQLPRVGLIADPADAKYNPDGLPVGLGKTDIGVKPAQLGVSCAFCHTNLLAFQGKTIRIEGGTTMLFSARFLQILLGAMQATLASGDKFARFAAIVLEREGQANDAGSRDALKEELGAYHRALHARASRDPSPAFWGYGRNDALGRGGNLVFGQLDLDNLRPANAPVSIPQIWGSWEYDWVQWNGAVQDPLARNVGQVIGVGARLFTRSTPKDPEAPYVDPNDPYRSSVNLAHLERHNELVKKLRAPRWPAGFPPINRQLAARGRDLYHGNKDKGIPNHCAHCHVPAVLEPGKRPSPEQTLKVTMIPLDEIRTDALAAENFGRRTVETGALALGRQPAKTTVALVATEIMKRAGKAPSSPVQIRAEAEYMARPHAGVWATPPFLHNGSVPTVYELLSPVEERHRCFLIGALNEYDPVELGLVVRECGSSGGDPRVDFELDTTRAGNSNAGHEFRQLAGCGDPDHAKRPGVLGCEIKPEDRLAIIEYLKTCDLDRPEWKEAEACRDLDLPGPAAFVAPNGMHP